MTSRKWNAETIGSWIAGEARRQRAVSSRRSLDDDLAALEGLTQLDSVGLQSLGLRLGTSLWTVRLSAPELQRAKEAILRLEARAEELPPPARAFLATTTALVDAVGSGSAPLVEVRSPQWVRGLADGVVRGRSDGGSIVNAGVVRSLIEPLLAGDRLLFRNLLGAISGALLKLESAGQNGRVSDVLALPLYWELKSLQWLLNGVLQGSRSRVAARAESRAGALLA